MYNLVKVVIRISFHLVFIPSLLHILLKIYIHTFVLYAIQKIKIRKTYRERRMERNKKEKNKDVKMMMKK